MEPDQENKNQNEYLDPEMLENIHLLINYDLMNEQNDWDTFEDLDALEGLDQKKEEIENE